MRVALLLMWLGALAVLLMALGEGPPGVSDGPLPLLIGAVGLLATGGLLLPVLAVPCNRTELCWHDGALLMRQGPIPWWTEQRLPEGSIVGFCKEQTVRLGSPIADLLAEVYVVMLIMADGRRVCITPTCSNAADAGLLAHQLQLAWQRTARQGPRVGGCLSSSR